MSRIDVWRWWIAWFIMPSVARAGLIAMYQKGDMKRPLSNGLRLLRGQIASWMRRLLVGLNCSRARVPVMN